jgi:hypothetical protein
VKKENKSSIYSPIQINPHLPRAAIMLDDQAIPAWVEKVSSENKDSGFADICCEVTVVRK